MNDVQIMIQFLYEFQINGGGDGSKIKCTLISLINLILMVAVDFNDIWWSSNN